MKVSIAKYVEFSEIHFNFSDQFKLYNIPNDILINMFDNIENRLIKISGNNSFIIIHRVADNYILKSMITKDNQ